MKSIEKHRERIESLRQKYPWVGEMADDAEREFAAMERGPGRADRKREVEELLVEYYAAVTNGVDGYDYTSGDLAGEYADRIMGMVGEGRVKHAIDGVLCPNCGVAFKVLVSSGVTSRLTPSPWPYECEWVPCERPRFCAHCGARMDYGKAKEGF